MEQQPRIMKKKRRRRMIRFWRLYGVLLAGCYTTYTTFQQWKMSLSQRADDTTTGSSSQSQSQSQQQQQQQQYPLGSAFLIISGGGGGGGDGAGENVLADGTAKSFPKKKKKNNNNSKPPVTTLPFKIGKNGMLLNNPWQIKRGLHPTDQTQSLQLQRAGGGYAPTGGALPTSPTFSTHYHENMWHEIDNGTCLIEESGDDDDDDDDDDLNHPVYQWQLRAPYVVLLGTMKGGTQALTSYLWQHPRFAQKDFGYEMHFFDQEDFVRNPTHGIPRHINQEAYAQRFLSSHKKFFLVEAMQQRQQDQEQGELLGQANHNRTNSTATTTTTNNNNNKTIMSKNKTRKQAAILPSYAMDSSPYYLLASDRIPDAILCVAPWAKWLAILRNPISRAESHFRHLHQARLENKKKMVDWQRWIDDDIRLLTNAGVLLPRHISYILNNASSSLSSSNFSSSWNATAIQAEFDAFAGSADEMQAWKRYNRSPSSQQIVGRGLYAIQIGHYIAALRRKHQSSSRTGDDNSTFRDKEEDDDDVDDDFQQVLHKKLLVLTSEDLGAHTQDVYNRVLDFLELPRHVLLDTSKVHAADTTRLPDVPMPHHVRLQLQRLYEPYNQRLFQMLQWKNTTWQ